MNKILIILLIFISNLLKAEYDSTYVLACKQKFAIPEDVQDGDYVGYWLANRTWHSGGTTTKSIETNFNEAFAINSSSGLITIADYTQINGKIVQQDTAIIIIIRTTCDIFGTQELDTAEIWVKENSYCEFISSSAEVGGDGSRSTPYDETTDITPTAGYGYFFDRGSVFSNTYFALISINATYTNPVIFAAYGTGAKPEFVGGGANNYFSIIGASGEATPSYNIYFYNLYVRYYNASAWYVWSPSDSCGWYNSSWTNCDRLSPSPGPSAFSLITTFPDGDIADSAKAYDFELINCYADTCGSGCSSSCERSFLKGAPGALIQNCYFGGFNGGNIQGYQLRLTQGRGAYVKHCIFEAIPGTNASRTSSHVQLRADNTTFEDCDFLGYGCGIYSTYAGGIYYEVQPDSLYVKNCYFYGQDLADVSIYSGNDNTYPSEGNRIEDCKSEESAMWVELRDVNNSYFRRNYVIGSGTNGSDMWEAGNNNHFEYNIIAGFSTNQIFMDLGSGHTFYNNTIDGTINCTGASSEIAHNNYATAFTSIATVSNNIDIDTITTSNHFIDYAGHDYHLKSTAISAIDQGYDWGQTQDYEDNLQSGDEWDIGAYEYQQEKEGILYYLSDTLFGWQSDTNSTALSDSGFVASCGDTMFVITEDNYIGWKNVNFGSGEINRLDIGIRMQTENEPFEIRIDSITGTIIANGIGDEIESCHVQNYNLAPIITGTHSLYIINTSSAEILHIAWIYGYSGSSQYKILNSYVNIGGIKYHIKVSQ